MEGENNFPYFISFPAFNVIDTDPQGSYTGVPEDWMEEPVQDVDDL